MNTCLDEPCQEEKNQKQKQSSVFPFIEASDLRWGNRGWQDPEQARPDGILEFNILKYSKCFLLSLGLKMEQNKLPPPTKTKS